MADIKTSLRRAVIALSDESDLPELMAKLSAMYKMPISLTKVRGISKRNLMRKYNLKERVNSLSPSKKAVIINLRKQIFYFSS